MGKKSPNMSETRVEMAMASHGHRIPLPRARNQPVMWDIVGPKVRSTYSTMPPEIGMAAVSSPKTAPIGNRNTAPMAKAIMAATAPPPMTIQSPTRSTHPVPMMAPNPMVKKFQLVRVFFIPDPCSTCDILNAPLNPGLTAT